MPFASKTSHGRSSITTTNTNIHQIFTLRMKRLEAKICRRLSERSASDKTPFPERVGHKRSLSSVTEAPEFWHILQCGMNPFCRLQQIAPRTAIPLAQLMVALNRAIQSRTAPLACPPAFEHAVRAAYYTETVPKLRRPTTSSPRRFQ